MSRSRASRRIDAVIVFLSVALYFAAYPILPRHFADGGVRRYRIRQFDLAWPVHFFAPAAFAESVAVRANRAFRRSGGCGGLVIIRADDLTLQFCAAADRRPSMRLCLTPWTFGVCRQNPPYPGGSSSRGDTTCLYYDCEVDDAVAALRDVYPRPYTVTKVLRGYEEACDGQTRIPMTGWRRITSGSCAKPGHLSIN